MTASTITWAAIARCWIGLGITSARRDTNYILSFMREALEHLKACGYVEWPALDPAPAPGPVVIGPSAMFKLATVGADLRVEGATGFPVTNFDRIRINPIRSMFHYSAALEGDDLSRGTMCTWTVRSTQRSAHHYITRRRPELFQCIPLQWQAWGCYNQNRLSWHTELENLGCFEDNEKKLRSWYDPATRRFYRWFWPGIIRSAPIEEFVFLQHPKERRFLWWHTYPADQIALVTELMRAQKTYNPAVRFCGHDDFDPQKLDPGPAFPWAQVRAALAG
jgi:hypothetical protein